MNHQVRVALVGRCRDRSISPQQHGSVERRVQGGQLRCFVVVKQSTWMVPLVLCRVIKENSNLWSTFLLPFLIRLRRDMIQRVIANCFRLIEDSSGISASQGLG